MKKRCQYFIIGGLKMRYYLHSVRFYILLTCLLISLGLILGIDQLSPVEIYRATILDRYFAMLALISLYSTLIISPLLHLFPSLKFKNTLNSSKRALGVSAFVFALFHGYFGFFKELGGFGDLGFLDNTYLSAVLIGLLTFSILTLLALTSFDFVIKKMGFLRWKWLHRLIYLTLITITIHALLLGSDFANLSAFIPQLYTFLLLALILLESIRLDDFLKKKYKKVWTFGPSFGASIIVALILLGMLYLPGSASPASLNVHAAHILLAKQAQQTGSLPTSSLPNLSAIPGLQGDRTRRYTVSFKKPDNPQPNQDTTLDFQVFDASSGNKVDLFNFVYSKVMHLVIVDNQLSYFAHIHPVQSGSHFSVTTQFPHPGRYHMYLDFQPLGAIEQQFAFSLDVGNAASPGTSTQSVDTKLTKTFGKYKVTLNVPNPLSAKSLSIGGQTITFVVRDARSGSPITTLKPYLASFGHLVMINEKTYDYLHVHPSNLIAPPPNANGGPRVDFIPIGIYGPIKPGIYRLFGQFNPDNNLFTADFTVKVDN